MYQDADTPALPCFNGVTQPDGSEYEPTRLALASTIYLLNFMVIMNIRLWIDLFHAINNAKKLIYITGWSVFTQVKRAGRIRKHCGSAFCQISLIRGDEAENCDDSNVGELLKRKAAEGVRLMKLVREKYILFSRCVFWL